MIDIVDRTVERPGSTNLGATVPRPINDIDDASITLRAKMNVTALITVRMTCDHHDSQVDAFRLFDAR
jgi:hypothetical protein